MWPKRCPEDGISVDWEDEPINRRPALVMRRKNCALLRRQRLRNKGAVNRDQPETLDPALREQSKGVARFLAQDRRRQLSMAGRGPRGLPAGFVTRNRIADSDRRFDQFR